ncbi:uncharacterized protein LOC144909462 [Branchiostoma floridae x Branchiostoma belcheri]
MSPVAGQSNSGDNWRGDNTWRGPANSMSPVAGQCNSGDNWRGDNTWRGPANSMSPVAGQCNSGDNWRGDNTWRGPVNFMSPVAGQSNSGDNWRGDNTWRGPVNFMSPVAGQSNSGDNWRGDNTWRGSGDNWRGDNTWRGPANFMSPVAGQSNSGDNWRGDNTWWGAGDNWRGDNTWSGASPGAGPSNGERTVRVGAEHRQVYVSPDAMTRAQGGKSTTARVRKMAAALSTRDELLTRTAGEDAKGPKLDTDTIEAIIGETCLLCGKATEWNQRAIACDECQVWYAKFQLDADQTDDWTLPKGLAALTDGGATGGATQHDGDEASDASAEEDATRVPLLPLLSSTYAPAGRSSRKPPPAIQDERPPPAQLPQYQPTPPAIQDQRSPPAQDRQCLMTTWLEDISNGNTPLQQDFNIVPDGAGVRLPSVQEGRSREKRPRPPPSHQTVKEGRGGGPETRCLYNYLWEYIPVPQPDPRSHAMEAFVSSWRPHPRFNIVERINRLRERVSTLEFMMCRLRAMVRSKLQPGALGARRHDELCRIAFYQYPHYELTWDEPLMCADCVQ